jgi:branched-subunit amino acid aminotransferase/4-amino-4-deoxychorismate lyase
MAFTEVPARQAVKEAIFDTLRANGMRDGAHMRLTLTRGKKVTSGMSPTNNQYGPTLIVLAEWKEPVYDRSGIRLITSAIRRNNPAFIDSKIHHNNLINNILAKIEANFAGVDDALMLDINGFAAETNATNVFIDKQGEVVTPYADACLPGITRKVVLKICEQEGIPAREKNLSLTEIWTADEMFTTGSMGELSPVLEVDGRRIGEGKAGPLTRRLQALHATWVRAHGEPIPD